MPSLSDLIRSSSTVFSGVVVAAGTSTVSTVPASSDLVTVRVTNSMLADPAIGDLAGRVVTVRSETAQALRPGEAAVFFTRNWIHADGIALVEIGRQSVTAENDTVAAIQAIPDVHLKARLESAELVVHAQVRTINALPRQPGRRAPQWAAAELAISNALKGSGQNVTVLYPTATTLAWHRCPHLAEGQEGIFVLRRNEPLAAPWLDASTAAGAGLTALDPADVQPVSEEEHVKELLSASTAGGTRP